MKVDKSLAEVWEWKDKVYEDIKTLSGSGLKEHFEKTVKPDFQSWHISFYSTNT